MLVLHAKNIKKYYGDRLIVGFDDFKIYSEDKIGIAGLNGAGKTTLMDILSGRLLPDEGQVEIYTDFSYIKQFGMGNTLPDPKISRELGNIEAGHDFLSGGEKTRLKIAQELSCSSGILFADEPTTNLDIEGIEIVENKLLSYTGALVLISHDRELLDKACTCIIEIEDGSLKTYKGNYTSYRQQKDMEHERRLFEYNEYMAEKKRLQESIAKKMSHAASVRKAPKRMGNSEARLHKGRTREVKGKLAKEAKAIESRLEKLEKKEKPKSAEKIRLEINSGNHPVSKVLVKGTDIFLSFGSRVLFDHINFEIPNRSKTALIGRNGAGKTTLIRTVLSQEKGISIANGTRIGYFSQELDILDPNMSLLDNTMKDSVQPASVVRTILARLLFKREDVFKSCSVLSGGERVKASFAKLLVSDANLLILDEPTNYLDIYSIEALQSVLGDYQGTLLFVSHDRQFIGRIADRIIVIGDGKAETFEGNLTQYNEWISASSKKKEEAERMKIENQIAYVLGALSGLKEGSPEYEALDAEFRELVQRRNSRLS